MRVLHHNPSNSVRKVTAEGMNRHVNSAKDMAPSALQKRFLHFPHFQLAVIHYFLYFHAALEHGLLSVLQTLFSKYNSLETLYLRNMIIAFLIHLPEVMDGA